MVISAWKEFNVSSSLRLENVSYPENVPSMYAVASFGEISVFAHGGRSGHWWLR